MVKVERGLFISYVRVMCRYSMGTYGWRSGLTSPRCPLNGQRANFLWPMLCYQYVVDGNMDELDDVSNGPHHHEPNADGLRYFDEFSSVGCTTCDASVKL